ncbi:MAG TPA: DinB family protein [Candidatus Limnocylindria bacterium]|nr:DinB family protein [Candidatus Limnocylindria bacterium]
MSELEGLAVRSNPPFVGADERTMLTAWLDFHRATLAMKCVGLDDDQLRLRAVPPSTLSLLGLVRHMTEVERHWFQRVLRGADTPPLYWSDTNEDGDFDDVDGADVAEDVTRFLGAIGAARVAEGQAETLEVEGVWGRREQSVSLRWILVHMIEEYARHNGHADLIRQAIDGSTGD